MKVRCDSAFLKLTEEDKDQILAWAEEGATLSDMADWMEPEFNIETTTSSLQRFISRLRRERLVEEAQAAEGSLGELAELGKDSKSREAALEAARQKLCDVAVESKDRGELMELMRTFGEEKAREHELAMRERAVKVAEENAKLGWRKLELQQARSALRLLPAIRAILMEGEVPAEVRVARARDMLTAGGGKLLLEGGGPAA